MKKKNLLLLSLLALTLAGCGDTSNSKSTSPKTSTAPISNKVDDDKTSTVKKDDTTKADATSDSAAKGNPESDTTTSTDSTSGVDSITDTESETTPSVLSDTYATSKWPIAIKDEMQTYLGGALLPYIDLGVSGSKLMHSWDSSSSTYTILGGTSGVTAAKLTLAKTTYENYGWDAKVSNSTMTATNEAGDITVTYCDDDGIATLTANYEEVFDPTKASAWPATVLADMNTYMGNHGDEIPFVYLATANPTGSWSDGKFTITGGTWDDQITSLAETAFAAANVSIAAADATAPTWTHSTGTNYYGTTFSASITLSDGTELTVSIEAPYYSSYYSSSRAATMVIKYKEPFSVPTSGSWSTDIEDMFTTDFDGHSIPWFYTGCTASLNSHTAGSKTAIIYGDSGTWDDQILTLAQQACEAENATITEDDYKWKFSTTSIAAGTRLTCKRNYSDGHALMFTVENYSTSTNKAEIHVTLTDAFIVPATGSWSQDVLDMFNNDMGGHAIPWFYTGGTVSISSHSSGSTTATLFGEVGTWDDQILDLAEAACTAEDTSTGAADANKWVCTNDTTSYGDRKTFVKTYADGCVLKFSVVNYGNFSSGNKAEIHVYYTPAFIIPTDPADCKWSDEILDMCNTDFDGHVMPWFYCGSKLSISTPSKGGTTATLYGSENTWDDQVLTLCETALTTENATIADDANKWVISKDDAYYGTKLTAKRTYEDGCTLKFTVENYSATYNKAEVHMYYQKKLTIPTDPDDCKWSANLSNVFTNYFDGHSIPWFYMGNDTLSSYTNGESTAKVYGDSGTWNDQIFTLAETALDTENAGITVEDQKWTYSLVSEVLTAQRTFEDGCSLKFTIQNYSTYTNKASMEITYMANFIYPTGDDAAWSDTINTKIQTLIGANETMPWIYLGCDKDDVTVSYSSSSEVVLKGGNWNDKIFDKAIEEFTNAASDGWSVVYDKYDSQVMAFKTTASGKNIKVIIKANSSKKATMEIYCK